MGVALANSFRAMLVDGGYLQFASGGNLSRGSSSGHHTSVLHAFRDWTHRCCFGCTVDGDRRGRGATMHALRGALDISDP